MKVNYYRKNIIIHSIEKLWRETTDGDVLDRWLWGVKIKFLAPFFLLLNWYRTSLKPGEKLPFGSYCPIVLNLTLKCVIYNRLKHKLNLIQILVKHILQNQWYHLFSFSGNVFFRCGKSCCYPCY